MKNLPLGVFLALCLSQAAPARAADNGIFGDLLPKPPKPTCAVSQKTFDGWKAPSGKLGDIRIKPPAADAFPTNNTFCDFYQLAAQAFLWATSKDDNGNFNLFGANFYEIVPNGSGGFTPVSNEGVHGNALAAKHVFRLRRGKPVLMGKDNPDIPDTGQAGGGGVLISQGNSLVYYAIHANDVEVKLQQNQAKVPYYQTTPDFPVSTAQQQQIATAAGTTFTDGQALAVEMKTSWVDLATLPAFLKPQVLTISAEVPDFEPVGQNLVWDGKTYVAKTLALVGTHVAISAVGHPEMIWATFEHLWNTEDNNFAYVTTDGSLYNHAFNSQDKDKIFFKPGTTLANANAETMKVAGSKTDSSQTISPTGSTPIGPVSTVRVNPWGNIQPASPTTTDPVTVNNTDLASLAYSLAQRLAPADLIRAEYVGGGAIWTKGGVIPTFSSPSTIFAGSTMLANSTMETYFQNPGNNQLQCFSCHSVKNSSSPGTDVSHIFSLLSP